MTPKYPGHQSKWLPRTEAIWNMESLLHLLSFRYRKSRTLKALLLFAKSPSYCFFWFTWNSRCTSFKWKVKKEVNLRMIIYCKSLMTFHLNITLHPIDLNSCMTFLRLFGCDFKGIKRYNVKISISSLCSPILRKNQNYKSIYDEFG